MSSAVQSGEVAFRATILLAGKTATGIRVPDEVVAALGTSRRPAVHATIAGYTYRSTVAPMRGRFMLPISADVRARAGVAAGDEVDVTLALDTAPREVTVPADFAAALAAAPEAERSFAALSYSRKRALVDSVEGAKTAETRERRIAKSVAALLEGRA
jgi:hypothetical protein